MRGLLLATSVLWLAGQVAAESPIGPDGKRPVPALLFRLGDRYTHQNEEGAPQLTIAAVYSPDGKVIATSGWDKLIRLWDAATGRPLRVCKGHEGPVYSVAFSPDGRTLASGSEDHSIRLWDVATAKERLQMKGHTGGVTRVAFTPDGRFLASGSYDKSVRLWRVEDGKEVRQFPGQQKGFTTICFSPDGRYLASGLGDREACLWETASGREVRRLNGHSGAVVGVAFSPDGYLLATAGEDHNVLVWEVWSGRPCFRLRGHRNGVWAVAFSPDGRCLASAGRDRTIRWWDLSNGNAVNQIDAHHQGIPMLAFAPTGRTLVSASHDATAALWNVAGTYPTGPPPVQKLSAKEIADWWEQLALPDPAVANLAANRLAAAPRQAVPFLRDRVFPAAPVAGQRTEQLIADLDSKAFRTRQGATDELEKLGERAEAALLQTLAKNPSLEARRRIETLLARLSGPITSPEKLRALRAVRILEQAGTPEARTHMATLADGAPGTLLTETARSALNRLARHASR